MIRIKQFIYFLRNIVNNLNLLFGVIITFYKSKEEVVLAMQTKEMYKAFGLRVKELRKQRNWTQKELAAKLDVRCPQLNKYEGGLHAPPIDKLVLLAEIFDTTVDYLLTGSNKAFQLLSNDPMIERLQELEHFTPDDRHTVIKLIDAMIIKQRVEGALTLKPFEVQSI